MIRPCTSPTCSACADARMLERVRAATPPRIRPDDRSPRSADVFRHVSHDAPAVAAPRGVA